MNDRRSVVTDDVSIPDASEIGVRRSIDILADEMH